MYFVVIHGEPFLNNRIYYEDVYQTIWNLKFIKVNPKSRQLLARDMLHHPNILLLRSSFTV